MGVMIHVAEPAFHTTMIELRSGPRLSSLFKVPYKAIARAAGRATISTIFMRRNCRRQGVCNVGCVKRVLGEGVSSPGSWIFPLNSRSSAALATEGSMRVPDPCQNWQK